MKKKKSNSIYVILFSALLIILLFVLLLIKFPSKAAGDKWAVYFAPTSTAVAYGNQEAAVVEVDSNKNITKHSAKAYPISGIINYKNDIIYQNPAGLSSLGNDSLNKNITKSIDTIGYNMSNTIKKDELFYFLLNESFKEDYYSSKLIIGDDEKQSLHQIKGFINAYGNDDDNIYLLTSDMKDEYSKKIQKISINSQDDIDIETNDVTFDTIVGSDNKMIISGDYLYCFAIKEGFSVSLLKISIDNLTVKDTFDLIMFNSKENNDKYYPASTNSIFYCDNKVFYPTREGKVYSFNIENNEFNEEFIIKDYDLSLDFNMQSSYNELNKEIDFLYFNKKKSKYCIATYNLNGSLKSSFYINKLDISNGLYPHSFIRKE